MGERGGSGNSFGSSPLILTLLLLTGVLYSGSNSEMTTWLGATPPKTVKSTAKPAAPSSSEAPSDAAPTLDPDLVVVDHVARDFVEKRGYFPEALIATVTDPLDSHDGWTFDPRMDSIMRAIEASGFLLDRSYVPWRYAPDRKPGAKADRAPDATRFGLILFRRPVGRRLLRLYVVGETPTWGINRDAFAAVIARLKHELPAKTKKIRILGPAYSGSALSLHLALGDAAVALKDRSGPRVRFVVRSGSATRFTNREIIEDASDGVAYRQVDYRTTVLPDGSVVQALWCYLEERGVRPENVALLRESATAYARAPRFEDKNGSKHEERVSCCKAPDRCRPKFEISFPMQISQVRNAYERNNLLKRSDQPQQSVTPQKTLELSLDDTGDPRDVLQPVTPAMSASLNELVLSNILRAISSESVLYVGIMATDARDKLFLGRAIHANAPDVRLFTYETDLLYAHRDYEEFLDGMLVASSYPLFTRTLEEDVPDNTRLQFSSQGAEGTYNATLALLGRAHHIVDYVPERQSDDGPETPTRAPASWIMAVSHGMMWPVFERQSTPHDTEDNVLRLDVDGPNPPPATPAARARSEKPPDAPSHTAVVVFLLILGFCAVTFVADRAAILRGDVAHVSLWRLVYLQALMSLMLLVAVPIIAYAFVAWEHRGKMPMLFPLTWIGVLAVAATTVAGLRTSLAIAKAVVARPPRPARRYTGFELPAVPPRLRYLVFVVPFVAVAVFSWYATSVRRLSCRIAWMRIVSPESGLSPTLPLLLAFTVIVLAMRCSSRRLRLAYDRQKTPLDGTIARLDDAFHDVLTRPFFAVTDGAVRWAFPVAVFVVLVLPCVVLIDRVSDGVMLSLETKPYNYWFLGIIAVGHTFLAFETARFLLAWSVIRRLLHALAFHPLNEAYANLPKPLQRRLRDVFYCYVRGDADDALWNTVARKAARKPRRAPATNDAAQTLQAMDVAASIGYQCTQMRNLVLFLVPGALLLFLSLNVYPFQPAGLLRIFCGATIVTIVGILLYVMFRMDRNDVLSHLAGCEAGVVTIDQSLIGRVLTFGVLPIATVVATQFPSVGRLLTSLLRVVN